MSLKITLYGFAMLSRSAACKPNHKCLCLMSNRAFVISWCWTVCRQLSWSFTDLFCCPSPKYVCSDLEQLRKIRRRSPHDDTEAFTVFLRSDVEAKLVVLHINQDIKKLTMAAGNSIFFPIISLPFDFQSTWCLGKSRSSGPWEKPPEGGGKRVPRK